MEDELEPETSVDYKYAGEWTLSAGILGSEEELNKREMGNTWR